MTVGLTPRERLLLTGVVEGLSNREIAERFGLTTQTVRNQLTVLYGKCGVHSRLRLAVWAIRGGVVD